VQTLLEGERAPFSSDFTDYDTLKGRGLVQDPTVKLFAERREESRRVRRSREVVLDRQPLTRVAQR